MGRQRLGGPTERTSEESREGPKIAARKATCDHPACLDSSTLQEVEMPRKRILTDCVYCGNAFMAKIDPDHPTWGRFCTKSCARSGEERKTLEERFWSKVRKTEACWLWTGTRTEDGYGRFLVGGRPENGGRSWGVHRFAYEYLVGPIPEGLSIDHVKARGCTSTLCVNPAHLEPVPIRVNILRGDNHAAQQARQTHCKNGHELSGRNLALPNSSHRRRHCLICYNAMLASRKVKRTEARAKKAKRAKETALK